MVLWFSPARRVRSRNVTIRELTTSKANIDKLDHDMAWEMAADKDKGDVAYNMEDDVDIINGVIVAYVTADMTGECAYANVDYADMATVEVASANVASLKDDKECSQGVC
ncbi:hypothetical protein J5N97_015204 [Dioscorea zingiberensis]|uniref:Uncharacterized protein n=1 Tax=Dioscorea zingiberensis TaxID=325984 RepID=A0A9D5CTS9_9LILI|nr:hypothetical protein J5N97_015204 [Dioscorea zingiberensis]